MAILPLCSALTNNHVPVSIGGSTYQHGAKHDQVAQVAAYTTAAPVYHAAAPAYHTPAAYQVPSPEYLTKAPAYATAAPVYHKPARQYHTAPQYHTSPQYHTAPQYHGAPQYHTPKQNCSVVDEVVKAKICTPAFETKCASVDVKVKAVVDKEQCQDITRTVCTTAEEVIENK